MDDFALERFKIEENQNWETAHDLFIGSYAGS